jgi:twitching motility two-component system response regulator PilH
VSAILLADDNPHAQRMGSQILSQEGHSVVTVSDGDEAMRYLEENLPDLVMVDTRMPGPSGFDICKHIKSQPKFGSVKVVLLAGPLEPFDTAEAENAGPDGVLHKPLDAYTLIDTVNSLLGQVPEAQDHAEAARPAAPPPRPQAAPTAKPREIVREAKAPATNATATTATAVASRPAQIAELSLDLSNHFASVVEQALGTEDALEKQRMRVEAVVRDVLEASLPAIINSITARVMASLDEE